MDATKDMAKGQLDKLNQEVSQAIAKTKREYNEAVEAIAPVAVRAAATFRTTGDFAPWTTQT